ncbi:MAG: uracil-xanthine permease family protein [Bacillota bacterium]
MTDRPIRRKPANLTYGVDENPPLAEALLQSLQQLVMISAMLIFPSIIVTAAGGSPELAQSLTSMTMIVGGLGTILQALQKPIGSGYLCPEGGAEPYLPGAILALKTGGLSLLCGMMVFAGLFQGIMSRFISRLRVLFPPEVTGLVVVMVGFNVIPITVEYLFGATDGNWVFHGNTLMAGILSLMVMIGASIWGPAWLRNFSLLAGLIVGYIFSAALGLFSAQDLEMLRSAPLVGLPAFQFHGFSFDPALIVPFLIASLSSVLKAIGDITTCQKINDADWKRPDLENISSGVLAESVKTVVGGLTGGLGCTTNSSSIGLSLATGVTSRRVAYAAGVMLMLLAFLPKLTVFFVIMPKPVMGACILFAICFMIVTGLQIALSRMADSRKVFVLGIAVTLGLSVDFLPGFYQAMMPSWLNPIFGSSISLATISVIVLNMLFRIGVSQRQSLVFDPQSDDNRALMTFIENAGSQWGARQEVIQRAVQVLIESVDVLKTYAMVEGPITIEARFDEFNLDLAMEYQGTALELCDERPDANELMENEDAMARLAGYMIKNMADRSKVIVNDSTCQLQVHFDH